MREEPPRKVPTVVDVETKAALHFAFSSLDERPVESGKFRGKPVVLAFIATGDLGSQAQMSALHKLAKRYEDVFFAAVAMEPRAHRELVELYRQSLGVKFPVAMADESTLRGESDFGPITLVPTTVVLDAQGRVLARADGQVVPQSNLTEVLDRARRTK